MLSGIHKYRNRFFLRPAIAIGFILAFSSGATAQVYMNSVIGKQPSVNPLLFIAFRKQVKPNPLLSGYIKPSRHELIYWFNFPLTPEQVAARDRELEKKRKQPIGQQILGSIAESYIKSLLSGKKMPVAVTPRF